MAGTTSLVNQFDDIVAATGVLCAGTEGGKRKDNNHCFGGSLKAKPVVIGPHSEYTHYSGYVLPVFSQFVDHQRTLHTRLQDMVEENTQLKVSKIMVLLVHMYSLADPFIVLQTQSITIWATGKHRRLQVSPQC